MFDILSDLNIVRGADQTLSGTTANNSALIDMQGWEALTVYLANGAITDAGTADGYTMKLQHSDTTAAADFVDCAAGEIIGSNVQVTSDTADNTIAGGIGYRGNKRYVRAVVTGTDLTAAVVNIIALRGHAAVRPVTTVGATTAAT